MRSLHNTMHLYDFLHNESKFVCLLCLFQHQSALKIFSCKCVILSKSLLWTCCEQDLNYIKQLLILLDQPRYIPRVLMYNTVQQSNLCLHCSRSQYVRGKGWKERRVSLPAARKQFFEGHNIYEIDNRWSSALPPLYHMDRFFH